MLDCCRHVMNGCFCPLFLCNYSVQVSANTVEFITNIVESILFPKSELTTQRLRCRYHQTPTKHPYCADLFSSFWALLL